MGDLLEQDDFPFPEPDRRVAGPSTASSQPEFPEIKNEIHRLALHVCQHLVRDYYF